MSLSSRIASLSMVVPMVAALGPTVAIGVAPRAAAEPCTGAAAAAQPPATRAEAPPAPGPVRPPIGQRPAGADEDAAPPQLGLLSPSSAELQQQAAVQPAPPPPPRGPDAATIEQPPAPPPAPPGTSLVGWVTGPNSPNDTIGRFSITGTDLGIMWDNGNPANRQVLMAFGDTYGYCSLNNQQWRYNVLLRSQDGALSKTVSVPDGVMANRYSGSPLWQPRISKPILPGVKWASTEVGMIPTAGIAVGGKQYLNYMSVKSWDSDGQWTSNYSAMAVSRDNGENWGIYPDSVRPASPDGVEGAKYIRGNENFQQGAFLKPGPGDPYIYSFGTPSGRSGPAFVARVLPRYVPDLRKYEYWSSDANAWVPRDPGAATPVIPGPLGEMSAQYNTYLDQYLVLYCNGANDVVMRTASAPQGPWSPEHVLARSWDIPGGIYAPYLHPWSTGKELYYNLSLWSEYNVMLMRTVLQ